MRKILIGVLVLGGLSTFLISGCRQKTEIIHSEIEKKEAGSRTRVIADIAMTTDCGDLSCFEEKFAKCEPATISLKLTHNLIYYYEIIGPEEGLCELKSKFLANPNPEWVGQEMTCLYDNSKKFEIATQDMSNCKGPLHDLLTKPDAIENNAEAKVVINFRKNEFFKGIGPEFEYQGPGSVKGRGTARVGNADRTTFHLVCHNVPVGVTYESGREFDNPKYDILKIKGSYWFDKTDMIHIEMEINSEIEGIVRIKGVMLDNKDDRNYKFKKGIHHHKVQGKFSLS